jgi:hypothetical protein
MKHIKILLLLIIFTSGLYAQSSFFIHEWDIKILEHKIQFSSKKKTPLPFSLNGETQAEMIVEASATDNAAPDLTKIALEEIEGIREAVSLDKYIEADYKAKDNVVLYFDKILNTPIAVIKYRTNGMKGGQKTVPRTVRQILFIHNDKLWDSSLIVLYVEDQNNMMIDQISFIRAILKVKY